MLSQKEIEEKQRHQLNKLLAWVGSKTRLASETGVSRQAVYMWIERGRISATAATIVHRKTDGLFKRDDLRPDVTTWNEEI
jgi:DNA-binding transcriptional regulator YdaS (Cro superfamily)